mgnify:CR=1 FL=1
MREEATGTRVQVADPGSQPRRGWRRKMTVELITGGHIGRRWSTVSGCSRRRGGCLELGSLRECSVRLRCSNAPIRGVGLTVHWIRMG